MKVLMVSKALVFAAYRKKLEEMAALGVRVALVVPEKWGSHPLEVSRARSYDIYSLKVFLSGKYHFHLYRGLTPVFDKVKPDIVHIDDEHYNLVTWQVMRQALRVGARPIFVTMQNILKKYPFPFSLVERYNFRHSAMAFAGNEEAASVLRKKGYEKPVAVFPHYGVDPDVFYRRDSPVLKKRLDLEGFFVIGFMGRFVEEKGIGILLEAFEGLTGEHARAALLLVGEGPLKGWLERRIKKHSDCVKKVKIVDYVSSLAVPDYLSAMDCLVLPSLTRANWKEQFGRVLIEAMACGTPVIGSNSGEIPNVIGQAGLICEEGSVEGLVEKLRILIESRELRERLGVQGRERVLAHYTQKIVAERTIEAYKAIMDA